MALIISLLLAFATAYVTGKDSGASGSKAKNATAHSNTVKRQGSATSAPAESKPGTRQTTSKTEPNPETGANVSSGEADRHIELANMFAERAKQQADKALVPTLDQDIAAAVSDANADLQQAQSELESAPKGWATMLDGPQKKEAEDAFQGAEQKVIEARQSVERVEKLPVGLGKARAAKERTEEAQRLVDEATNLAETAKDQDPPEQAKSVARARQKQMPAEEELKKANEALTSMNWDNIADHIKKKDVDAELETAGQAVANAKALIDAIRPRPSIFPWILAVIAVCTPIGFAVGWFLRESIPHYPITPDRDHELKKLRDETERLWEEIERMKQDRLSDNHTTAKLHERVKRLGTYLALLQTENARAARARDETTESTPTRCPPEPKPPRSHDESPLASHVGDELRTPGTPFNPGVSRSAPSRCQDDNHRSARGANPRRNTQSQ
ncbi:MAG: hypothetical protein ACRERU_22595 [Methylococcales bacterium]